MGKGEGRKEEIGKSEPPRTIASASYNGGAMMA